MICILDLNVIVIERNDSSITKENRKGKYLNRYYSKDIFGFADTEKNYIRFRIKINLNKKY